MNSDREKLKELFDGKRERVILHYEGNPSSYLTYYRNIVWNTWYKRVLLYLRYIPLRIVYHMPISKVKIFILRCLGVKIGKNVYISPFVEFDPILPELIEIGDNVLIGMHSKIFTHELVPGKFRIARVKIEKNSFIGANVLIRGGVKLEEGSFIKANTIVYSNTYYEKHNDSILKGEVK